MHTVDLQRIEDFKLQLIGQSQHTWSSRGLEIAYVGWLTKPRRREGSRVVEFTNPNVANNALTMGTVWPS